MENVARAGPEIGIITTCPHCYQNLSLRADQMHNGTRIPCPVCKKKLKIRIKGLINKKFVLEKGSFF